MIHAYIASLSGIPVIYSGDELAQLNDNHYTDDPVRAVDSRFIHRGKLDWKRAEERHDRSTVQGLVFSELQHIIRLRSENAVFHAGAHECTLDSGDRSVLAFRRVGNGQTLTAVYNFCESRKHVHPILDGRCRDLFSGREYDGSAFEIDAYQALWLLKTE